MSILHRLAHKLGLHHTATRTWTEGDWVVNGRICLLCGAEQDVERVRKVRPPVVTSGYVARPGASAAPTSRRDTSRPAGSDDTQTVLASTLISTAACEDSYRHSYGESYSSPSYSDNSYSGCDGSGSGSCGGD